MRFGGAIWAARREALAEVGPLARDAFAGLMARHTLRLGLYDGLPELDQAGSETLDEAGFADAMRRALAASYPKDRARGATSVGPHRSDLRCWVDGHDVRSFASQGQQRAVVLALKLAELTANRRRLGSAPILLLDDVSSELDAERTACLFAAVARLGCQTWVTTTGAVQLPVCTERQTFVVRAGEVVPQPA